MAIISTNFKNIIGRIIMLCLFVTAIYLAVYYGSIKKQIQNGVGLLYFIITLLIWVSISTILSFLGIIKVEINTITGQIVLIRLFSKKTIEASEVIGYYISVYKTKYGTSFGRIIQTSDNKIYELNQGNLNEVVTVDEYFNNLSIEFMGEKTSFYPFTSGL
jgi:hypothetical protein